MKRFLLAAIFAAALAPFAVADVAPMIRWQHLPKVNPADQKACDWVKLEQVYEDEFRPGGPDSYGYCFTIDGPTDVTIQLESEFAEAGQPMINTLMAPFGGFGRIHRSGGRASFNVMLKKPRAYYFAFESKGRRTGRYRFMVTAGSAESALATIAQARALAPKEEVVLAQSAPAPAAAPTVGARGQDAFALVAQQTVNATAVQPASSFAAQPSVAPAPAATSPEQPAKKRGGWAKIGALASAAQTARAVSGAGAPPEKAISAAVQQGFAQGALSPQLAASLLAGSNDPKAAVAVFLQAMQGNSGGQQGAAMASLLSGGDQNFRTAFAGFLQALQANAGSSPQQAQLASLISRLNAGSFAASSFTSADTQALNAIFQALMQSTGGSSNGAATFVDVPQTAPAAPAPAQPTAKGGVAVTGTNGTYQIADGTYRMEVKFEDGHLVVVEPNKVSRYVPEPGGRWGHGVFVFTNPVNGITYRMQVLDRRTLLAFKTDTATATRLNLLAEAPAAANAAATTASGTGVNTASASGGACKAREVVVSGQKYYITQELVHDGVAYDLLGDYYYEGRAGAHPMVRLAGAGNSFFERHGVEQFPEFRESMSQWGLMANCDGTAIRKGYGGYVLAFQKQNGSWDTLEYGVLPDRGIALILGERQMPLKRK